MDLIRETQGGEPYEYYPLGRHAVAAPGVCGGRPTFKYTRLEVSLVLDRLASGEPVDVLLSSYTTSRLTREGIEEVVRLAGQVLGRSAQLHQLRATDIA
jgi:uncharacterized protein (DUF433 family)